jgi:hypothetical protein
MATSANIIFPGAILYRHYDGHPADVLEDLAAWIACERPIAGEQYDATSYSPARPVYEPMDVRAGNAKWVYIVNPRRQTVRVFERDLLRDPCLFRAANVAAWAMRCAAMMETRIQGQDPVCSPVGWAGARDSFLACRDLAASFSARTGYRLVTPPLREAKPAKPKPVEPARQRAEVARYQETKSLALAEVAKLIKRDILAAQKRGELPSGKVSVRSTGTSINGRLAPNDPRALVCEQHAHDLARDPHARHSCARDAACRSAQRTLDAIHFAYNYDASDLQADYFDVRYYGQARVQGVSDATEAVAREIRDSVRAEVAQ